jgi:RNA polymerase sigma-70 factor (ECF subfamily)
VPSARPRGLTPEHVFRAHAPRIYNLARRMLSNEADVEDVTQEVLLQVVRKLDTFRGEAELTTWLHRVTVNACLVHRRRQAPQLARRISAPVEQIAEEARQPGRRPANEPAPDRQAQDRETRRLIDQAILRLPDIYRDPFVLSDVEGLPNSEISTLLGLTLPAVKSRLHRARLLLRDALSPYFADQVPGPTFVPALNRA